MKYLLLLLIPVLLGSCLPGFRTPKITEKYPTYSKGDLGITWQPEYTTAKIWAPTAEAVKMHLYGHDIRNLQQQTFFLKKAKQGVWEIRLKGNQKGKYFTFQVKNNGQWLEETPSPWAKAAGTNSKRGQIINPKETLPEGWIEEVKPPLASVSQAIIYELHLRDLTTDSNSGITHKGKYLGLTEINTKNPDGLPTGIDHIKQLGVTHVHLLPVFDFKSVDEELPPIQRKYNWGYDPELYNVPEGSYASNPADATNRILEFKKMILALHQNGLRVVMDVVYNHTGGPLESAAFNKIEPGYFYRYDQNNNPSNASGCGNETASERSMVRQFILESVCYWAKEYHIDGFRFDLMGIHDIQTMNEISRALHQIDPQIILYGEGWTSGPSPLQDSLRAIKANTAQLDRIAVFSDELRDGLKGSVFDQKDKGFVSGKTGMTESVKFGIIGATNHPQVNFNQVNYSKNPWAAQPTQCINYADCHDNNTLWDKLSASSANTSEDNRQRMHKLALGIVLTAQGIPFLHAGTEFCRSKKGVENSFESPDSINSIPWNLKTRNLGVVAYVKGLIELRKLHPAFRMPTAELIAKHLEFLKSPNPEHFIAYRINNYANGDNWANILVLLNAGDDRTSIELPPGNWTQVVSDTHVKEAGIKSFRGTRISVPAYSMMVLRSE